MIFSATTILVAIAVGLILSAIIMFSIRAKLKSVHTQRTACKYERDGSFNLSKSRDTFLFRNVKRVPRPQHKKR